MSALKTQSNNAVFLLIYSEWCHNLHSLITFHRTSFFLSLCCFCHHYHTVWNSTLKQLLLRGRRCLGSIRNKNNYWKNASKHLFGSYSHSAIPGFPFQLFCSQEQNSQNIFWKIYSYSGISQTNVPWNDCTLEWLNISFCFHFCEFIE